VQLTMASNRGEISVSGGKRLAQYLGIVLTVICLVYIGWELRESGPALASTIRTPGTLIAIGLSAALWMILNAMLGLGWGSLVKATGNRVGVGDAVILSLMAQAGKYLPGNVFHLAGRVWLAGKFGIERKLAAIATAAEMGLLVIVAVFIGLPWLLQQAAIPWVSVSLAGLIVLALLSATAIWYSRNRERLIPMISGLGPRLMGWLVASTAAYGSVFVIQTVMFALIGSSQSLDWGLSWVGALQIVTITWLAGFVVVGSPGGLGVREAAFAVFAQNEEMRVELLLIAALMRVASLVGDLGSLGIGAIARRVRD
jgi:hypothetical protein